MPVTRNQTNAASNTKQTNDGVDSSGQKDNVDRGETSVDNDPPRRDSPDNCSICLGPFNNKSFTSSCAHSFCFVCLKQWSKVKAECPLCKQPFTSIFHNIRSNDSYDIYELPPLNPPRHIDYNFYNYVGGSLGNFPPAHQYFNFSQPTLDADLTLSNFSRFQFRHRRYDRFLNPVPGEHQYSYTSSSLNPSNHVSAASWPRGAEDFRRQIYRHHMGPPALILGSENSTYRLTPAMVAASAHRLHRIMPWLTRELRILLRSHQNVRLAISIIQPLLTQVTIDSSYFREKVLPLIGQKSQQFIQEFVAFANSALNMQSYDRKAMYRRRMVYYDEDTSSSSGDDEVVEVSDVSPENQELSSLNATGSRTTILQQSGWDSPTPGPSWESIDSHPQIDVERVSVSSESDDPVFRPDLKDSESDNSKPGSDIVFVKYDKPWNERSPIQLSSDTEVEGRSRKKKKVKHKKRCKDLLDTDLRKKGKGHKSSKSKSRSKSRAKSKSSSGDQAESESGSSYKRTRSTSSSEKQKKKKQKRSKDKADQVTAFNKDRELVDRLFAKAFTQQQSTNTAGESAETEAATSSRPKDSHRKGDREKNRKRKKKRNVSRSSASPTTVKSYKKHHSGHKKSSDPHSRDKESDRKKSQNRRLSREDAPLEQTSQMGSYDRSQPLTASNMNHNITSTFQTSYLPLPDTVQHIPLNLWVSTWPTLPVSHTFPTAPPSTSFPLPPISHTANSTSSALTLTRPLREQRSSILNSQTISSGSSSESDSVDSPNNFTTLPQCTRTNQWLEANFLTSGRKASTMAKTESSSSNNHQNGITESLRGKNSNTINILNTKCDEVTDIVLVASDDEDIVVCSSASSTKSDSDEVRVLEMEDCLPGTSSNSGRGDQHDDQGPNSSSCSHDGNADSQNISGELKNQNCGIFQPFKLQKKLKLTKPNVDPLFSTLAQSSDDEPADDVVKACSPRSPSPGQCVSANPEMTSSSVDGLMRQGSPCELNANMTECGKDNSGIPHEASSFDGAGDFIESSSIPLPSVPSTIEDSHVHRERTGESMPASTTSSSCAPTSTSGSPVFDELSSIPTPSMAVAPIISSSLNYLPYTPLPTASTLSSILPQALPFVVPPPPPPPSLPLHFPFTHIPSLLHPPSSLFSSVFPAYSQSPQVAATASCSLLTTCQDPLQSFTPLLSNEVRELNPGNGSENANSLRSSPATVPSQDIAATLEKVEYDVPSETATAGSQSNDAHRNELGSYDKIMSENTSILSNCQATHDSALQSPDGFMQAGEAARNIANGELTCDTTSNAEINPDTSELTVSRQQTRAAVIEQDSACEISSTCSSFHISENKK